MTTTGRQTIQGGQGGGTPAGAFLALALALGALTACGSSGTKGGASGGAPDGGSMSAGSGGARAGTGATVGGTGGAGGATLGGGGIAPAPGDSVLMFHRNLNRDGVYVDLEYARASLTRMEKSTIFAAVLPDPNDHVYAQPLFVDLASAGPLGRSLLIVATEANNVYALDARTGAQVWVKNVGAPVPLSAMPCGNLDPYGITGTPVIDLPSRSIFLDAMTTPDGGATKFHQLFALSLDTGAVQPGWPVDVGARAKSGATAFNVAPQSQRGGLAIVNGTLYAAYGGLYGDCGSYHGWVVAVSLADPNDVQAWATMLNAGGIWAPGGVSSDGTYVYVATGNTSGATLGGMGNYVWGGGEAVLRFPAGAALGQPAYFALKNWATLDNEDLDLGATPIPFDLAGATPGTLALTFGKDGNAYLLDRTNLAGVGDALATLHVANNEIIAAPVLYTTATATYAAFHGTGAKCTSGSGDLVAIKIVPGAPPSLAASWCATAGAGTPIVTTSDGHKDAIVWTFGAEGDGLLHGFDGDTGEMLYGGAGTNVPNVRRSSAMILAEHNMYVAADGAVVKFEPLILIP